MSVGSANMQLPWKRPEPQFNISCPSVASLVEGKMPKFSTFNGDSTQKGEVLFEQWVFEVKSVMQSHTEATLREGIVWSLCSDVAILIPILFSLIITIWLIYDLLLSTTNPGCYWGLCRILLQFVSVI